MWRAQYGDGDGESRVTWTVGVESRECPRAGIAGQSRRWIEEFVRAKRCRESLGGVYGGADVGGWPARWVDVVTTIQGEVDREQEAMAAAMSRRRPGR